MLQANRPLPFTVAALTKSRMGPEPPGGHGAESVLLSPASPLSGFALIQENDVMFPFQAHFRTMSAASKGAALSDAGRGGVGHGRRARVWRKRAELGKRLRRVHAESQTPGAAAGRAPPDSQPLSRPGRSASEALVVLWRAFDSASYYCVPSKKN